MSLFGNRKARDEAENEWDDGLEKTGGFFSRLRSGKVPTTKKCPHCRNPIAYDATVCEHCGTPV
jgi:hypothetical protein